MNRWRARDPVMRFQNLMLASDWWDAEKEKQLRVDLRKEVNDCSELSFACCLCVTVCEIGICMLAQIFTSARLHCALVADWPVSACRPQTKLTACVCRS